MKEQLIHILDQSVCLSRKQMKEYLNGTMLPEEAHAAEVHLSSCPLCSLAMEGFEAHTEEALAAISALNSGFLKEHFDNISPQIHLNSMAPAATMQMSRSGRKRQAAPLWKAGSVAAGLLLLFGLVWAFEHRHREVSVVTDPGSGSVSSKAGGASNAVNKPSAKANTVVTPSTNPVSTATQETFSSTQGTRPDIRNVSASVAKNASKGIGAGHGQGINAGAISRNTGEELRTPSEAATGNSVVPKLLPAKHTIKEYNPDEDGDKPETSAPRTNSSEPRTAKAGSENNSAEGDAAAVNSKERGDNSYSKGSFEDALVQYKKGMNSSDLHVRYRSMVMAAQCYAALGNKKQAEQLLQRAIDNAPGPERRQARHALHKLQ